MANEYELVYKLGARVSSQFMSSFDKASGAVKQMSAAIGGLTGKAADVSKLVKLRQAAEKSSQTYEKQKAVVENLRQNMEKLQGSDSKMARALEIETQKLDKAKQAMQSQSQAATELGQKLKLAGVSTADLMKKQTTLTTALERVNKIQTKLNRTNRFQQNVENSAMASTVMVEMIARRAVSIFSAPVKSAMEMEQVMRNLGDTLDIRSPEALLQLQKTFEDLSLKIPVAKENLAAMYALAKQNGIGGDLGAFTEQAAKFATVLKIDGTQAVSMFTDWNAKLSQTTEETFRLANATVMLSNHNANFAKGIAQTVLEVGEYAKRAGLAEEQTAAIAAAMVSTGSSAEDAAMGIRQMIKVLSSGEAMGKTQASALQAIGFGDPKSLQARLQKDTSGVMLEVMSAIRDKIPQNQQLSILEQMFGKQGGKTILPMMRNLESLSENLEKVTGPFDYINALSDEFDSKMQNTTNVLELATNAWQNFTTMIGEPLLEPLKEALRLFIDISKPIADWIRENKELVRGITNTIIVGTSLVAGFHLIRAALLFTVSPLLILYKTFLRIQQAVTLVNVAMKAGFISPLGLAVGAIAAVVAAGVLLYKNWDKIKAYLDGLWQAFEEKFPGMAKAVTMFYENSIKPIVGGIRTTFQGLIDFITGIFTGNWQKAWEGVKSVFAGIWQSLSGIIKGPINAMITAINYVIKGVNSLGSFSVPDWVPGVGGKAVGINILEIPRLATGGIVTSLTIATIGESNDGTSVFAIRKGG